MLTYMFECLECQHHFEIRRSIKDSEPVSCPKCEGQVRTVIFSVPIFFKINQKEAALNVLEHHPLGRQIHAAADIAIDRWHKQKKAQEQS